VDSGTTLAYLVEEAYDPFVSSVSLLIFLCFFFFKICLKVSIAILTRWLIKLKHNWCPVSK
jgi:hypothetical protein